MQQRGLFKSNNAELGTEINQEVTKAPIYREYYSD